MKLAEQDSHGAKDAKNYLVKTWRPLRLGGSNINHSKLWGIKPTEIKNSATPRPLRDSLNI